MNIVINYEDLNFQAIVKIFQLADLLGVTPKVAAETYLRVRSQQAQEGKTTVA